MVRRPFRDKIADILGRTRKKTITITVTSDSAKQVAAPYVDDRTPNSEYIEYLEEEIEYLDNQLTFIDRELQELGALDIGRELKLKREAREYERSYNTLMDEYVKLTSEQNDHLDHESMYAREVEDGLEYAVRSEVALDEPLRVDVLSQRYTAVIRIRSDIGYTREEALSLISQIDEMGLDIKDIDI